METEQQQQKRGEGKETWRWYGPILSDLNEQSNNEAKTKPQ